MKKRIGLALIIGLGCAPWAAHANDDAAEFWLNPSVSFDIDTDTGIEIETAQRLRSEKDGRADTYFARIWLNQDISENATLSGAFERRVNDGGADETRLMQQLSSSHGYLRTRMRLEQRFIDSADRVGLRLRPRIGVAVPLDTNERWKLKSDAELFVTLRSTNNGGDHGLTGLRTQILVSHDLSEQLTLSAGYLRQQDVVKNSPDRVGHAPIIGLDYSF
jgi:hypothetical protein